MSKPTVLLATDIDFWNIGLGSHARVAALARFLVERVNLKVAFVSNAKAAPPGLLARLGLAGKVEHLFRPHETPTQAETLRRFASLVRSDPPDSLIVEYIWLHYLLDALPTGVLTFLDTHDLMSARTKSFAAHGRQNTVQLDLAAELELFSRFDHPLMIQDEEYREVRLHLGPDKPLLIPHPAEIVPRQARPRVSTLGFFGSASPMNADALLWFGREVWPAVKDQGLAMNVFGSICLSPPDLPADFLMKGPVGQIGQAHLAMDLAVNPVLYGAGLKIKNVEALGHGLPLVTSSVGAAGMSDGAHWAFAVADTPGEWIETLNRLISEEDYRRELANGAVRFARERFSPQTCFAPLLRALGVSPQ